jgi:hypothetical protein
MALLAECAKMAANRRNATPDGGYTTLYLMAAPAFTMKNANNIVWLQQETTATITTIRIFHVDGPPRWS